MIRKVTMPRAFVRRFRSTSLILTVSLSTPFDVWAQAPDTVRLKAVVVTATRVPVSIDAVAAAVTVVTGSDLRARGLRTVADALRAVPGAAVVETGSLGGQTSLFLRGGESDYVKVLIDGVALNLPGGSVDLADLTLDNVERIEVVRGPASVLYGSDAVTGVIQIFTRAGQGAPRLDIAGRAGRYATTDLSAQASGRSARAAWSVGVSRVASAGLYPYNNDYRNTVVTGRLRVAPGTGTDATLAYRWGDNVYHFPTNGAGEPVDSNQFAGERGPGASVALRRALGGGVDGEATATLREQRLRFSDAPDSPGEGGGFESRDLVRRASLGAALHWRRGTATLLTAGVEYEDERQRGRNTFDSVDVARWNRAVYAQALLGVERPLAANLGVRIEDNSQFGGHATVRAGLVYRLDGVTRIRAALGTGFKEPTFFENFARGFVRGDPNLDPERSASWEVGLEHVLGPVTLAVTYFDQRFRDLIEFTFTPAPPDSVNYFNVAGASADGVEATVDASLSGGVGVGLRYTYLDARVLEAGLDPGPAAAFSPGRPLLRRPAHTVTGHARAGLGDRAVVALDARLVGRRDDLDFTKPEAESRVTLGAYGRVDLAAEYTLALLTLTGRVENLLDDDAHEVANFLPRGRTALVGGRVSFGR